ncbi:MAG: hypothetical protein HYZ01_14175 [Ignavibacteriales bacterium]|nr:hypothetical protein [Ignavibacteriales bacterium]
MKKPCECYDDIALEESLVVLSQHDPAPRVPGITSTDCGLLFTKVQPMGK